jgi:DNA repair protein RecO (recombination protein O)
MLQKTRGIVLKSTPFKETSRITRIFTEDYGVLPFIIHGVRNGKGAIKPAQLMPLNLVDLDIYFKETANLHKVKELRQNPLLTDMHFNVVKNSVVLFVAEIIDVCLKEEESDPDLFHFLSSFIEILDLERGNVGNYPLFFLTQFTRYLGLYPKGKYSKGQLFDLEEGVFVDAHRVSPVTLEANLSEWMNYLLNCPLEQLTEIQIPKSIKEQLLNNLLLYFELHAFHGRKIKSHQVLQMVFHQ